MNKKQAEREAFFEFYKRETTKEPDLSRYTEEEHPIGEKPPFKNTDDYWKSTYLKMLDENLEILKKLPGNTCVIDRIKQLKQLLYQWWYIDVDYKAPPKKGEQLELDFN